MTAANMWVRVEDQLPAEDVAVLVTWSESESFAVAIFREGAWLSPGGFDEGEEFTEPTHWQPLPEGPTA